MMEFVNSSTTANAYIAGGGDKCKHVFSINQLGPFFSAVAKFSVSCVYLIAGRLEEPEAGVSQIVECTERVLFACLLVGLQTSDPGSPICKPYYDWFPCGPGLVRSGVPHAMNMRDIRLGDAYPKQLQFGLE